MKSSHVVFAGLALLATVTFGGVATAQNAVGRFFFYDAESRPGGQWAAQPPFFPQPWQEPDTPHPRRAKIVTDPTAPQGTRVLQWEVTPEVNHDLYTEIKFDKQPPAERRTYYFAFFVRFDRRDGRDIWHHGRDAESFGYLELNDLWAPVVLQMGRAKDYDSFEAFQKSVKENPLTYQEGKHTYTSEAGDTYEIWAKFPQLPKINGKPIDLNPDHTFNSPYLKMKHGSNKAVISYPGYESLMLEF